MRPILTAALVAILCLVAAPRPARGGVVTVGRLDGTVGEIVRPIVEAAEAAVTIDVVTTSALDAAFFSSIDVFIYANASGAFVHTMGATGRSNLLNFVNGGGTAYIGVDQLGDGTSVASAFGFTLADRLLQMSTATITDIANPIAAGPFQPSAEFTVNAHGRFNGSAPANGAFIGSAAYGNLLGYRTVGAGRVYIFADEVPLTDLGANHFRMFQNVLVGAGADVIPVRPPVVATNSFLVPQKVLAKTSTTLANSLLRVSGTFDTGGTQTDLAGPAQLTIGATVADIPGLRASKNGRTLRYAAPGLSLKIAKGQTGSSRAKFSLRRKGDLTDALALDAGQNGRLAMGLRVDVVDAGCDVAITAGRFRYGAARGAFSQPSLHLLAASGTAAGGGADAIVLTLAFATDGTTPVAAKDLRVEIGPVVDVTILASEFTTAGDTFVFTGDRGGITKVTIDHRNERITIAGSNLDLGPLPAAANPLTVVIEEPEDARSVAVLLARKGNSLRY